MVIILGKTSPYLILLPFHLKSIDGPEKHQHLTLSKGCMSVNQWKERNLLWSIDYRYRLSFLGRTDTHEVNCNSRLFPVAYGVQTTCSSTTPSSFTAVTMACRLPAYSSTTPSSFTAVLPQSQWFSTCGLRPLWGVAYQICCIPDTYITIRNSNRITVMK